jgi:cytochrome c biogenesis protein CcmG, thiol:disulfide interchange protein DsbE
MADFPDPDTSAQATNDARTARRIRVLQVVAGALIAAAITLLAHGLLTPAAPTSSSSAAGAHTTPSSIAATTTPAPVAPLVGHFAPDATLRTMNDRLESLSSLRGSVVLLNFWYVSCPPCQLEMPALERTYLKYQAMGFTVVGIDTADDASTISAFTTRIGITYPILRDIGERAVLAYSVRATPSSYLIDRNGVIRAIYTGPVDASDLSKQAAALL